MTLVVPHGTVAMPRLVVSDEKASALLAIADTPFWPVQVRPVPPPSPDPPPPVTPGAPFARVNASDASGTIYIRFCGTRTKSPVNTAVAPAAEMVGYMLL